MGDQTGNKLSKERIIAAARTLFGANGFHSTPVAELAKTAGVSVGQIYRHFPGKDDIIVAIVAEDVRDRLREMDEIFSAVGSGSLSVFEAIKAIARTAMTGNKSGLNYEILAESSRNRRVAEQVEVLVAPYRAGVKRLASLVQPHLSADEQDGYADIMMACFFGMGHHTTITPGFDIERASDQTALLIMRALSCAHG